MIAVRARVRNGRLILDEPTDLPEGTEIALVSTEVAEILRRAPVAEEALSAEESRELHDAARGPLVEHAEVRRKILSRTGR